MIMLTALLLALPAAQVRPAPRVAQPDRVAPPACERCDPRAARPEDRPRFRPTPSERSPSARRPFERPQAPRLRLWLRNDPQLRAELRALLRERALERRSSRRPLLRT
jgi:hypothetical protein